MKNKTYHKKKILVVFTCAFLMLTGLIGRLVYLMVFDAEYYQKRAEDPNYQPDYDSWATSPKSSETTE